MIGSVYVRNARPYLLSFGPFSIERSREEQKGETFEIMPLYPLDHASEQILIHFCVVAGYSAFT